VPNNTTVSQAQGSRDFYCSGTWPCQPGEDLFITTDLAAGQSTTLQFAATVDSGSTAPPAGTLLTSTATSGLGGSALGVVQVIR
jgi:hypothetical protein